MDLLPRQRPLDLVMPAEPFAMADESLQELVASIVASVEQGTLTSVSRAVIARQGSIRGSAVGEILERELRSPNPDLSALSRFARYGPRALLNPLPAFTLVSPPSPQPRAVPGLRSDGSLQRLVDALQGFGVSDQDSADHIVRDQVDLLWARACLGQAVPDVPLGGSDFDTRVLQRFHNEYRQVLDLDVLPTFPTSSGDIRPSLAQRRYAWLVHTRRRVGNWSGTGSGKTVAALLAVHVSQARRVAVVCPNRLVGQWEKECRVSFPGGEVRRGIDPVRWKNPSGLCVSIVNYEGLIGVGADQELAELARTADFVIVDEIHFAKSNSQDEGQASQRRAALQRLLDDFRSCNPDGRVAVMTATPVINSVKEGWSLLSLLTGYDLGRDHSIDTVENCLFLNQHLLGNGIRHVEPSPQVPKIEVVTVDASPATAHNVYGWFRANGHRSLIERRLPLEQILVAAKLDTICELVKPGTIIYTMYKTGIVKMLVAAIRNRHPELKISVYTGDSKPEALERFINGETNVLIGSDTMSTGIDHLQDVASRMIFATLPWTDAAFQQTLGRVDRLGQDQQVEVFIPVVEIPLPDGSSVSWCKTQWARIEGKQALAAACLDGELPEDLNLGDSVLRCLENWVGEVKEVILDDTNEPQTLIGSCIETAAITPAPYRPAAEDLNVAPAVYGNAHDPDQHGAGWAAHNATQNALWRYLYENGFEASSHRDGVEPEFDLSVWVEDRHLWVVEVKSVTPQNEHTQTITAVGQVLGYTSNLTRIHGIPVYPVIVLSSPPADRSFLYTCEDNGIVLVWPDIFETLLAKISDTARPSD